MIPGWRNAGTARGQTTYGRDGLFSRAALLWRAVPDRLRRVDRAADRVPEEMLPVVLPDVDEFLAAYVRPRTTRTATRSALSRKEDGRGRAWNLAMGLPYTR